MDHDPYQEMESDIVTIAHRIFCESSPPLPKSFQLVFEEWPLPHVFESLLQFFTEGMKILYGNSEGKVELSTLSENDFTKVAQYHHAIGMNPHLQVYEDTVTDYERMMKEHFMNNDLTKLEDYRFRLKSGSSIYVLYFSFL